MDIEISQVETPRAKAVLKPIRYMRSPPSMLTPIMPNILRTSPDSMTRYLKRIIKKQCKIYQKVSSILNGSTLPPNESSIRIPLKTSRLSPYVYHHEKLKPLPSKTPQPKLKKKIIKEEKEKVEENSIGMISVSTKRLNIRKKKHEKIRRIEVGINTKEEQFPDLEEDPYEDGSEEENDEDDLDEYFSYKGCLS